jgi:hypothetical protein
LRDNNGHYDTGYDDENSRDDVPHAQTSSYTLMGTLFTAHTSSATSKHQR